MVIPNFVRQALANEEVTVFGDGTQTRTFTHVGEVCDALIKLIDTPAAYGEVVNVGGIEEVSMKELAEAIIRKTFSSSTVKLIPYDQVYTSDFEDMPRRVPCTEKLKSLIGFAPKQNLDSILDDIISNFKAD
jgi:UDP-glucose 4-epimerase